MVPKNQVRVRGTKAKIKGTKMYEEIRINPRSMGSELNPPRNHAEKPSIMSSHK